MWKAIFIESCLLSALIFGGFYINAKIIQDDIDVSDDSIKELSARQKFAHIRGSNSLAVNSKKDHLSGSISKTANGHISGIHQKQPTSKP